MKSATISFILRPLIKRTGSIDFVNLQHFGGNLSVQHTGYDVHQHLLFVELSLVSRDSSRNSNEHKTEKKCHRFVRIAIALFKLFVRGKLGMSIVIKMQCAWHHSEATTSWRLLLIVSDLISSSPRLFIGANRSHSLQRDDISLQSRSQSDASQISWIEINWDE